MPVTEAPSYSSTRVQRAARINSIEAVRLKQRLYYLEKAKMHQCRLTNQDIRLISLSIDYIQSCSGHSPEAWRPETNSSLSEESKQAEEAEQGPLFMYGERIISRKKRRVQRPMSAVDRAGNGSSLLDDDSEGTLTTRPKSSPVKKRPSTALSFFKTSGYDSDSETLVSEASNSRPSTATPREVPGRLTPHQDWEDETFEITKRIMKAQELAHYGKAPLHHTVRNVRGLTRFTKIPSTPISTRFDTQDKGGNLQSGHSFHPASDQDFAPRKPPDLTNRAGRRATLGEILSQRQPTLSAGEWRTHLNQTTATPLSIAGHRQLVMDTKKQINDSRNQKINDRVRDFMGSRPRSSLQRSNSSLR